MSAACEICEQPIYRDVNGVWCLADSAPLHLPLVNCFDANSGYYHQPSRKED
jgi:hypothetical protein